MRGREIAQWWSGCLALERPKFGPRYSFLDKQSKTQKVEPGGRVLEGIRIGGVKGKHEHNKIHSCMKGKVNCF